MKFGLVYDFRNPAQWRRPWGDLYTEIFDHISAVESMGFDTVWLTEHHFVDDGYLPSMFSMAGAVAARTHSVQVGIGSVMLLPLHHPLRVAEDAAVLDIISEGRIRLGTALGYVPAEFSAFGVDRRCRASIFEESIEVIRKAWSSGPVRHHGRHWQLPEIEVHPKPLQEGGPAIYVGGRAEKPIRRAARIGDGAIVDAEHLDWYYDELRKVGREASARACVYMLSAPTGDPEAAMVQCGPHMGYRMSEYAKWYGEAADLPSDRHMLEVMQGKRDPDADAASFPAPFVTADEMIVQLEDVAAKGATEAWWFGTYPGLAPTATLDMWQILADDVIPHFR
jgi:alkanesulfonate monooxygenase SsuD/methylene tetrahydromethanopterin reductase-like flavin-dependent oxidoreductase (luciferase family)